jgi:sigma-B regulation protein RsbQ
MLDVLKRNNVTIRGRGEETILFAHGFGCSQNTWREVAPAFEDRYRVILFDYVGSGQSDLAAYDPQKYSSLEGYAQDILDICKALGSQRYILVAHSVSCMIAVAAALEQPQLFDKLVFVSPSPYYFADGEYNGGLNRQDIDGLFEMMDNNYLGWSSLMAPMIMGNPQRPELGEDLTSSFCANDPAIARQFAKVSFYTDCRPLLPQVKVESLTLQCADDMLAPIHIGSYITEHKPNSALMQLKATGHCPHLSAPEEVIQSISQFLERAPGQQDNSICRN